MKNSGFMKVFKFSYEQGMKSKSTKIMLGIFVAIALLFLPVKSLISGGLNLEEDEKAKIETVYVQTDNEELFNTLVATVNAELENEASFNMVSEADYDKTLKKLEDKNSDEIYLQVNFVEDMTSENFGLSYKLIYGNGEDAKEIANSLDSILMDKSKDMLMTYYGIDEETAKTLVPGEYETKVFDVDGKEVMDDSGLSMAEYWISYGFIMVFMIVVMAVGSTVAQEIVAEKANRVIEYIMLTLKPMDLIIGKVLSGIAQLFTIVGSTLIAFAASTFINKAIDKDAQTVVEMIEKLMEDEIFKGFNVINILIAIAVIFAGSYFYSILGGLSGGMVSKVEEMSEGLKIYTVIFMIGVYLAMFMMMSASSGESWGAFSYVVYLLPASSLFVIPPYILMGKIELWIALVALVVCVIVGALFTALASRVFGQMIYHNGSPLKIKDIMSMTKEGKKHEK